MFTAPPDQGHAIHAEITKDGKITMTNDRNGYQQDVSGEITISLHRRLEPPIQRQDWLPLDGRVEPGLVNYVSGSTNSRPHLSRSAAPI